METRLELCNGVGEDYEQLLSIQTITKDANGVSVRLDTTIGIRHIDSVDEVIKKLRDLADSFECADKRMKQSEEK